jgi:hypothetical protein
MIFNIVSGGLIIKDSGLKVGDSGIGYSAQVSKESYILAVVNIALCVLYMVMLLPKCFAMMGRKNLVVSGGGKYTLGMSTKYCMFLMIVLALNIGYSVFVMKYWDEKKPIDKLMYDLSMSVVVLDSLFTLQFLSTLNFKKLIN